MLPALFREEPELVVRRRDFSADRGLDSGPLKAQLWDAWRIRPLIPARRLWREERTDAAERSGAAAVENPARP
ncbi:MAG: hypothetical protein OXI95_07295 [bacterium]|nr:hypothetical protein [bacterium]